MYTYIEIKPEEVQQYQADPLRNVISGVLLGRKPGNASHYAQLSITRGSPQLTTLTDLKDREVLYIVEHEKPLLYEVCSHLGLTTKSIDEITSSLLIKAITYRARRLGELITHPAFSHLKAVIAPTSADKRYVFVFKTEYLHSPVGIEIPRTKDKLANITVCPQSLDVLNRMFSNGKASAIKQCLEAGLMGFNSLSASEILTGLSASLAKNPFNFPKEPLIETLKASKGAWIVDYLPNRDQ